MKNMLFLDKTRWSTEKLRDTVKLLEVNLFHPDLTLRFESIVGLEEEEWVVFVDGSMDDVLFALSNLMMTDSILSKRDKCEDCEGDHKRMNCPHQYIGANSMF